MPSTTGGLASGNGTEAKFSETPLATGRLLTYQEVSPNLRGRQAEVGAQAGPAAAAAVAAEC